MTTYLDDLETKGFAVVKGVLSPEASESYRSQGYDWLERLAPAFQRDDKSTWHVKNLPPHAKGGMYQLGGVAHEQFFWDLKCEQAIIDAFAAIWKTKDLLVSFDGMNFALPLPNEQYVHGGKPWPHVDQSPLRTHLHCVQGIMALTESGPTDGGLMVLRGSKALYSQFFEAHERDKPESGWPQNDLYLHTEEQLQWFYDRGCEWEKICCNPGDLLLWDSRCIHYGEVPRNGKGRVAAYICYKPASMITPEGLELRKEAFTESRNTTHDPVIVRIQPIKSEYNAYPLVPLAPPVLTETGKKLAGLVPYA